MAIELPKMKTTARTTVERLYSVRFTEDSLIELLNYAGYPVDGGSVVFTFHERDSTLIVEWSVKSTVETHD